MKGLPVPPSVHGEVEALWRGFVVDVDPVRPALVLAPADAGVPALWDGGVDGGGDVEGGLPLSGGRLAAPMALAAMVAVSEMLLGAESTLTQMWSLEAVI